MVFQAGLHGVDLNSEIKNKKRDPESGVFQFKAPEDYEKMPMEDRVKLTQQMIHQHKFKFT